ESGDFAVLVGDQRLPVERRMRHRPAKPGGIFELVVKAGGIDEKLLGHTAADHAGTAEPVFLGKHDVRPVLGGNAGSADAARSASDYEKIGVMPGHITCRVRASSSRCAFCSLHPRKAYPPNCRPSSCFPRQFLVLR